MIGQRRVSEQIWLFSGFDADGRKIEFEYPGPDSHPSQSFPFFPVVVVGRDPARCHFVLHDGTVSGIHAELRFFPDRGIGLRDLKSRNRTRRNGNYVQDTFEFVAAGDELHFGRVALFVSHPR